MMRPYYKCYIKPFREPVLLGSKLNFFLIDSDGYLLIDSNGYYLSVKF